MRETGLKITNFIKKIDRKTVFIALTIAITIAYYINPLSNVDLTKWNRAFSSAALSGISIDLRINNFYKLFFLGIPLISILLLIILVIIFMVRPIYKDFFMKLSIFLCVSTFVSYISRYTSDASKINSNPMLQCIVGFLIILAIIALLDRKERLVFADIVLLFLTFIISITSCMMLFHAEEILTYIVIMGIAIIFLIALILYSSLGEWIYPNCKNFMYFMMWLPVVIRVALEGIYFLTEKGRGIGRYYTHICRASIIFIVLVLLVVYLFRKRNLRLASLGYIGAITSFATISYFSYSYQYVFSYGYFANIYELGNVTVAADSFLHGKLPIIDYFSAHALGDVWTRLVYCFIHGDIKGILVDPYAGLASIIAFIVLFYIIKELFGAEIAVLYVLFFPGIIVGIKWTSLSCLSIAILLYICRKPSFKSYVLFWICTLISAFTIYDEGISLGVACILAYLICCLLQNEWRKLKQFILCGASVGTVTLILYVIYAVVTGLPVIGRIKEWISVSIGSSSSWATADFGDQTTFAFLISYFIVPMTAVALLIFVLVKFIKSKKHMTLTILTVAFALSEILYISRTIVYHNLAICSGRTGVLLNFIHWTVSVYVLYRVSEREKSENVRLLAFSGAMMAVILIEGIVVTGYLPLSDSILLNKGLKFSEEWDLQDNVSYNQGQPRIVYNEQTTDLVNQFSNVFDTLLTKDQTYIDFANVTSMYMLTGRTRPCYVGQSPSLLTDLNSQESFLAQISKYDCPLAIVGTTETPFIQQMVGVPHNVRYYKIAEHVYNHYRPLVTFGEFVIWCEKESYDTYKESLTSNGFIESGYNLVDYGYDFTTSYVDENGKMQLSFMPYHSYDLGMIPYVWANHDERSAIDNNVIEEIYATNTNKYIFDGSQDVVSEDGNYLAFEMTNSTNDDISANIVFYDSTNEGAKTRYYFTAKPGKNQYLIRVSGDYFWDIYNIDTVMFGDKDAITIENVRILEGD